MTKDYGVHKYQSAPKQWTVTASMGDYAETVGTYDYWHARAVVREMRDHRSKVEIGYAYPTSDTAISLGKSREGSYFVRSYEGVVFSADTWEECRDYVDRNQLSENRWSMATKPGGTK